MKLLGKALGTERNERFVSACVTVRGLVGRDVLIAPLPDHSDALARARGATRPTRFERGQILRGVGAAGFTMVEIALSLAIIAFALVAIMGVLPAGTMVQKANREDTIVNQDGALLLEAIRNGSIGLDPLTNYVEGIKVARTNATGGTVAIFTQPIDRGIWIIGRLSTPKYESINGIVTTNTITAKIRALAGAAADKSLSPGIMAFSYLLQSEVVPYAAFPTNDVQTNWTAGAISVSNKVDRLELWREGMALSNNLYEVRLTLRWPVIDQRVGSVTNWLTGPYSRTFRTLVSGQLQPGIRAGQRLYFFRPFAYAGF